MAGLDLSNYFHLWTFKILHFSIRIMHDLKEIQVATKRQFYLPPNLRAVGYVKPWGCKSGLQLVLEYQESTQILTTALENICVYLFLFRSQCLYHGCWCPGSLHCQVISSQSMELILETKQIAAFHWCWEMIENVNINGLAQGCSNSTANALELLQSCAKTSIYVSVSQGSTLRVVRSSNPT